MEEINNQVLAQRLRNLASLVERSRGGGHALNWMVPVVSRLEHRMQMQSRFTREQIDTIIGAVGTFTHVDVAAIKSRWMGQRAVAARHLAMYFVRELSDWGLEDIGNYFGRDHSSTYYSWQKTTQRALQNSQVASMLKRMRRHVEQALSDLEAQRVAA